MKFEVKKLPRIFEVGDRNKISIADCAELDLEPNEQVTFKTASGAEYDVTRKEWGYLRHPRPMAVSSVSVGVLHWS
jgi:hypothetical protein